MKQKHIHLTGYAIYVLIDIVGSFIDEYENIHAYEEEIEMAKRIQNFLNSENTDYYEA